MVAVFLWNQKIMNDHHNMIFFSIINCLLLTSGSIDVTEIQESFSRLGSKIDKAEAEKLLRR